MIRIQLGVGLVKWPLLVFSGTSNKSGRRSIPTELAAQGVAFCENHTRVEDLCFVKKWQLAGGFSQKRSNCHFWTSNKERSGEIFVPSTLGLTRRNFRVRFRPTAQSDASRHQVLRLLQDHLPRLAKEKRAFSAARGGWCDGEGRTQAKNGPVLGIC